MPNAVAAKAFTMKPGVGRNPCKHSSDPWSNRADSDQYAKGGGVEVRLGRTLNLYRHGWAFLESHRWMRLTIIGLALTRDIKLARRELTSSGAKNHAVVWRCVIHPIRLRL